MKEESPALHILSSKCRILQWPLQLSFSDAPNIAAAPGLFSYTGSSSVAKLHSAVVLVDKQWKLSFLSPSLVLSVFIHVHP